MNGSSLESIHRWQLGYMFCRTGNVLLEIEIPAPHVTSLAFGGPDLDILFVTTGNDVENEPVGAGYLYKITGLCATGYAGVAFNLY